MRKATRKEDETLVLREASVRGVCFATRSVVFTTSGELRERPRRVVALADGTIPSRLRSLLILPKYAEVLIIFS